MVNQTIEAPQTIETRGQTTTQVNNSRRRTIVENQVINDTETVDRGVEQTTTRRRTVQRQTQPQQQTTVVEHTTERVQQPKQPEQTVGRETKNETIVLRGRKIQRTTTRTTTTTGANSEQVRNKATIEDDNKDSLIDETIKRIKQHTDKRKLSRKKRDSNKNK